MTVGEFCAAVSVYGRKYNASCTSWGRSVQHSVSVGGFNGDPHTHWLGADLVYDSSSGDAPHLSATQQVEADAFADALGLWVIHEDNHDHLQPKGWVNTPL